MKAIENAIINGKIILIIPLNKFDNLGIIKNNKYKFIANNNVYVNFFIFSVIIKISPIYYMICKNIKNKP